MSSRLPKAAPSSATGNLESSTAGNRPTASSDRAKLIGVMKAMYQAAHQVEYLHLRTETELLLRQLQALKQQRVAATDPRFSS
jgi:ribonuclease HI